MVTQIWPKLVSILNSVSSQFEHALFVVGRTVFLKSDMEFPYEVLCVYEKHYNKWYVSPAGKAVLVDEKGKKTVKGKYRLLLHLQKPDELFSLGNYREYVGAKVGDTVKKKTLQIGDVYVLRDCVDISVLTFEAV